MNERQCYEIYPTSTVVLRTILALFLSGVGAAILVGFGMWAGLAYLAYCIVATFLIMRFRCKYCVYYGKTCSGGTRRMAAPLFKPGDNADFPRYIKYIAPIFLVGILPVLGGVVLLVVDFSVVTLVLLAVFFVGQFIVSERVLVKYGCDRCKQRDTCPGYQLTRQS
jgi:hypothetical protein